MFSCFRYDAIMQCVCCCHTRVLTLVFTHTCMCVTTRKLDIGIISIKIKVWSTTGHVLGLYYPKHYELGLAKGNANRKIKLSNTGRAGPACGGSIHCTGANSFPPRGREEKLLMNCTVYTFDIFFSNLHTFSFCRTLTLNRSWSVLP